MATEVAEAPETPETGDDRSAVGLVPEAAPVDASCSTAAEAEQGGNLVEAPAKPEPAPADSADGSGAGVGLTGDAAEPKPPCPDPPGECLPAASSNAPLTSSGPLGDEFEAEQDYQSEPIASRFASKDLARRCSAYAEAQASMKLGEDTEMFAIFKANLSTCLAEALPKGQDAALTALVVFLDNSTKLEVDEVLPLVRQLLEHKAIDKPKMQQLVPSVILSAAEVCECPPVVKEILESIASVETAKKKSQGLLKKQVAFLIKIIQQLLEAFGSSKMNPKLGYLAPVVKYITDKEASLREACYGVLVELSCWIIDIKEFIKNVEEPQKNELAKRMADLKEEDKERGIPPRHYRSEDPATLTVSRPKAVDALKKLPTGWCITKVFGMDQWKAKQQYLQQFSAAIDVQLQLTPTEGYHSMLPSLLRLLKTESNIAMVAETAKCVGLLARGLRRDFERPARQLLPIMLSKIQDKSLWKQNVLIERVEQLLFALPFDTVIEELRQYVSSKSPFAKKEALALFRRALDLPQVIEHCEDASQRYCAILAEVALPAIDDADNCVRSEAAHLLSELAYRNKDAPDIAALVLDRVPAHRRPAFVEEWRKVSSGMPLPASFGNGASTPSTPAAAKTPRKGTPSSGTGLDAPLSALASSASTASTGTGGSSSQSARNPSPSGSTAGNLRGRLTPRGTTPRISSPGKTAAGQAFRSPLRPSGRSSLAGSTYAMPGQPSSGSGSSMQLEPTVAASRQSQPQLASTPVKQQEETVLADAGPSLEDMMANPLVQQMAEELRSLREECRFLRSSMENLQANQSDRSLPSTASAKRPSQVGVPASPARQCRRAPTPEATGVAASPARQNRRAATPEVGVAASPARQSRRVPTPERFRPPSPQRQDPPQAATPRRPEATATGAAVAATGGSTSSVRSTYAPAGPAARQSEQATAPALARKMVTCPSAEFKALCEQVRTEMKKMDSAEIMHSSAVLAEAMLVKMKRRFVAEGSPEHMDALATLLEDFCGLREFVRPLSEKLVKDLLRELLCSLDCSWIRRLEDGLLLKKLNLACVMLLNSMHRPLAYSLLLELGIQEPDVLNISLVVKCLRKLHKKLPECLGTEQEVLGMLDALRRFTQQVEMRLSHVQSDDEHNKLVERVVEPLMEAAREVAEIAQRACPEAAQAWATRHLESTSMTPAECLRLQDMLGRKENVPEQVSGAGGGRLSTGSSNAGSGIRPDSPAKKAAGIGPASHLHDRIKLGSAKR